MPVARQNLIVATGRRSCSATSAGVRSRSIVCVSLSVKDKWNHALLSLLCNDNDIMYARDMADQQSPTAFNRQVGRNIGHIRRAAEMSQADLAQELTRRGFPIQQQTILTIEKGTRPLKLEEAEEIAKVLRVDPRSLVESDDERTALL